MSTKPAPSRIVPRRLLGEGDGVEDVACVVMVVRRWEVERGEPAGSGVAAPAHP